jgi:hypothetical protein
MELPNIKNTIIDEDKKITYHVMAYRELNREERVGAVRYFLSTQKKKPKPNSTITIVSLIR